MALCFQHPFPTEPPNGASLPTEPPNGASLPTGPLNPLPFCGAPLFIEKVSYMFAAARGCISHSGQRMWHYQPELLLTREHPHRIAANGLPAAAPNKRKLKKLRLAELCHVRQFQRRQRKLGMLRGHRCFSTPVPMGGLFCFSLTAF